MAEGAYYRDNAGEATGSGTAVSAYMRGKSWYRNSEGKSFDWPKSAQAIATQFCLRQDAVMHAVSAAFTPKSLSYVFLPMVTDGQFRYVPLLQALKDIDITPHVWTEGDGEFQKEKIHNSTTDYFIPDDHVHCYPEEKCNGLEPLVRELARVQDGTAVKQKRVIIVDDKLKNVAQIKKLREDLSNTDTEVLDYFFGLHDEGRSADDFFRWLQRQTYEAKRDGQELIVILDFDGVIVDTNSACEGKAAENIWQLILEEQARSK